MVTLNCQSALVMGEVLQIGNAVPVYRYCNIYPHSRKTKAPVIRIFSTLAKSECGAAFTVVKCLATVFCFGMKQLP